MNRAERRRKEREERKTNKCISSKILTFDDLMSDKSDLEDIFICEKCGIKTEIEYTEMPIITCIECYCGNQQMVQICKGFITWKMPNQ